MVRDPAEAITPLFFIKEDFFPPGDFEFLGNCVYNFMENEIVYSNLFTKDCSAYDFWDNYCAYDWSTTNSQWYMSDGQCSGLCLCADPPSGPSGPRQYLACVSSR